MNETNASITPRPLEINGKKYRWNFASAYLVMDSYCKSSRCTKDSVYDKISLEFNLSKEAIKNWFDKKNGPGKGQYVLFLADFFGVNLSDLVDDCDSDSEIKGNAMERLLGTMSEENVKNKLQTITLIGILNELAFRMKKGFMSFNDYVNRYYDESSPYMRRISGPINRLSPGIIYVDEEGPQYGKIVCDIHVDYGCREVISTMDDVLLLKCGVKLGVDVYRNNAYPQKAIILVHENYKVIVVVEEGYWHCP